MNKSSGWAIWWLMFAGNGAFVFAWFFFELISAGSVERSVVVARFLVLNTVLSVVLPLIVSIYFMLKEKFKIGLVWIAVIIPLVIGFSIFIDMTNLLR